MRHDNRLDTLRSSYFGKVFPNGNITRLRAKSTAIAVDGDSSIGAHSAGDAL